MPRESLITPPCCKFVTPRVKGLTIPANAELKGAGHGGVVDVSRRYGLQAD